MRTLPVAWRVQAGGMGCHRLVFGGDDRHGQFVRTDDLFPSIPFFA